MCPTGRTETEMAKKKKKLKKVIIIAVIAVLILLLIFARCGAGRAANVTAIYSGDIFTAAPRDVEKTVSATGLIESDEDTTAKVYSTLAYEIAEVKVSLGDRVEKGDILCVYDKETLERTIKEKELSMNTNERAAALSLANAKLNYNTYQDGIKAGTNANVVNAKSAYDTALENYDKAVADYDEYVAKNDTEAIRTLNAAKRKLDSAEKDYNDYKSDIDNDKIIELAAAKRNLDNAEKDYNDYKTDIENGSIIDLATAKRNVDKAEKDYNDLKTELENGTNLKLSSAKRSLDTALKNYEDYKDMVDDDETSELMSAKVTLEAAEDTYDAAKATETSIKGKIKVLMANLEDEMAKPEGERDAALISRLEGQIEDKETELAAQERKTASLRQQYLAAEDAYDKAYDSADMTLETYKTNYENAKESYDLAVKELDNTLYSYEKALADAKDAYTSAGDGTESKLESYEMALLDARDSYNTRKDAVDTQLESYEKALLDAKDAYDDAKESVDDTLESYADAVTTKKRALDDAAVALKNAEKGADDQLESYRISYETAKNNAKTALADYQLANLYTDLEKTEVAAPISGTVTAIYAEEDVVPNGVMFVIEDTENLVVTSTVKAYDLGKVSEGMKVKIETDASGDDVYFGVVESIAPAAVKDASGSVVSTNDAEFETVVRITDKSDRLRIGVSARIEYVVDAAPAAVAVPSSAVLTDNDGSYVLCVSDGSEGGVILTRTAVECGVTDGIYTAVSGIDENTRVADNAKNYAMLVGKELSVSEFDPNATAFNMGDMMVMGPMGG